MHPNGTLLEFNGVTHHFQPASKSVLNQGQWEAFRVTDQADAVVWMRKERGIFKPGRNKAILVPGQTPFTQTAGVRGLT